MLEVHDNEIISYEVNLKDQRIIIHSIYQYLVHIDIVFYNVLAHLFENHLKGSIILSIDRKKINQFTEDNIDLLKKQKNYCWPMDYDTIEELEERLLEQQYVYYIISSSYGLYGWVLAKNYETIQLNK